MNSKEHIEKIRETIKRRYQENNHNAMGFQKGHGYMSGGWKKGCTSWNKLDKTTRRCPQCNKIYIVPIKKSVGAGYRKYCSFKCATDSRKGRKPWNKNRKTGIIPKTAFRKGYKPWNTGLDKSDKRIQQIIKTRREHDNYKQTEKTKKKIRKARAKQKFPFNNTSIEVILQKGLDKHNIEYETQKYSLSGTPDIFIKPNICIFADGDYWHNLPERSKIDKKNNEKLRNMGYIVLRFWEHEILEQSDKCLSKIIATYGQRKRL